jgi:hypothetical protein
MSVPIVLSSRTSVEREDDTRAMEEIVLPPCILEDV